MGNLVLNGSSSGQITVSPPAVAGTNTVTLPATTGTLLTTAGGQTIGGTETFSIINATTIQVGGNQAVNGPAFSAYQSTLQSISGGTWSKIALQSKTFDTNSNFDNTTNYRFTPTVAGYYQINAQFSTSNSASGGYAVGAAIYKNGSAYKLAITRPTSNTSGAFISDLIYFNGSTDYVELYGYADQGSAGVIGTAYNFMSGSMVRGA